MWLYDVMGLLLFLLGGLVAILSEHAIRKGYYSRARYEPLLSACVVLVTFLAGTRCLATAPPYVVSVEFEGTTLAITFGVAVMVYFWLRFHKRALLDHSPSAK